MTFCAIIPDRNDRKELTEHCLWQLSRMTIKPDVIYHMNYQPESERFDLTERVKRGWLQAKADGIDWCFITENDDAYDSLYFNQHLKEGVENIDFSGDDHSVYYNIKNRTWKVLSHAGRASLFTTGFRTLAMNDFRWPNDNSPFLDIKIWEYADNYRKAFVDTGAVGIKHAIGKCGGKGHKMVLENSDPELDHLRRIVDKESFEFYKGLQL
jgi:hypothetical protein